MSKELIGPIMTVTTVIVVSVIIALVLYAYALDSYQNIQNNQNKSYKIKLYNDEGKAAKTIVVNKNSSTLVDEFHSGVTIRSNKKEIVWHNSYSVELIKKPIDGEK